MLLLGTFVYGLFAVLGLLQAIHLDLPPHLFPTGILRLASNTIVNLRGLLSSTSTLNRIAGPKQCTDLITRRTTDLIIRRTTDLIIRRTADLIIRATTDLDILRAYKPIRPIRPTSTFSLFPSPTKTRADTLIGSSAMMVIAAWVICGLVLAAVAISWNMERTITRRQDTGPGASPFGVFASQCPSVLSVFGDTPWSLALLGFPSKTVVVPAVRHMHATNTEDGVTEVISDILGIQNYTAGTVFDMVDTPPHPPHGQLPQHDDILPAHPALDVHSLPLELVQLTMQTMELFTETNDMPRVSLPRLPVPSNEPSLIRPPIEEPQPEPVTGPPDLSNIKVPLELRDPRAPTILRFVVGGHIVQADIHDPIVSNGADGALQEADRQEALGARAGGHAKTLGSSDMETVVVVPPKKPPPAAPPRPKPVLARRGISAIHAFLNPPSRKSLRKERAVEHPTESGWEGGGLGGACNKDENDTRVGGIIVPGITAIIVHDRTCSYVPGIADPSSATSSSSSPIDKADSALARVDDAILEETPEPRSVAMSMDMSLGSMSCRVVTGRRGKGKGKKAAKTMTLDEALSAAA